MGVASSGEGRCPPAPTLSGALWVVAVSRSKTCRGWQRRLSPQVKEGVRIGRTL
jgi:hypothetical protein